MSIDDAPPLPTLDHAADEITTVTQMLDFYRTVLLHQGWGLTQEQLAATLPGHPSKLSIGGLLLHMALVEDIWFSHRFAGEDEREPWASMPFDQDPDSELTLAATMTPEAIITEFTDAVERSRNIAGDADFDVLSARAHSSGSRWNLRWIMVHMIEEYARHCGHADFLRESIDGTTYSHS